VNKTRKSAGTAGLMTLAMLLALAIAAPARAAPAQQAKQAPTVKTVKTAKVVKPIKKTQVSRQARPLVRKVAAAAEPARLSFGQAYGLHDTTDPLDLKSSVAFVIDQETNEVLFSKNSQAVLPIASITKLMTALVVTEAAQPLDELLTVTQDDVDTEKGSGSRLSVGTVLSRGDMLHLALMSSENRAAHALGRNYVGGLPAFVEAMNRKALQLGMNDTHYVEPTGLSSRNQSSARDLSQLVKAASGHSIIRELSTSLEAQVAVGKRQLQFRNTNGLVRNPSWEISLQKTGYISEAGRCVVMQAQMAGRKLIMVLLDSAGKYSRIGDAERIRKWVSDGALVSTLASQPIIR